MIKKLRSLDYIELIQESGISVFSTGEFQSKLKLSLPAARAALRRLREARKIATPLEGFHVIVPPQYRRLGCLPAEQFIDYLMKYLDEPYYVALLSAAEIYGAAHQKPQVFQVMVEKKRPEIKCGQVRIEFVVRKNLRAMPTQQEAVRTGYVRLATPECTACDLVGYWKRAGGLDNVATVLLEMKSRLRSNELCQLAPLSPIAWIQRLGFLLDSIGAQDKARKLSQYIAKNTPQSAPLLPGKSVSGSTCNKRWKIYENTTIEPDEV